MQDRDVPRLTRHGGARTKNTPRRGVAGRSKTGRHKARQADAPRFKSCIFDPEGIEGTIPGRSSGDPNKRNTMQTDGTKRAFHYWLTSAKAIGQQTIFVPRF